MPSQGPQGQVAACGCNFEFVWDKRLRELLFSDLLWFQLWGLGFGC